MAFNSLEYLLFLPCVYLTFYIAGERARWLILLASSLLFYSFLKASYLLFVLVSVAVITYLAGIWLDRAKTSRSRSLLLWGGVAFNLIVLAVMKYLPFLPEYLASPASLFAAGGAIQPVALFAGVGVSYYVFQAISYLLDIYLEIEKPERHFGYFTLYLAFFPKLLQGPIERAGDLLPQLRAGYLFNYDNMRFGLLLFSWGLFKKIVVADRLGLYVDTVYNDVSAFSGASLLLATYAYAFQIYLDFSGYTDMALGSARLFNISLTQNFASPYLATSVADFWRRWHISFSRWILDYVFKPLQMQWRDRRNAGTAMALVAAFLVSGVWHGASWGFVVWGGLHGVYMACSVYYRPYQKKLHKAFGIEKTGLLKALQIMVTFNLVSCAWVFFRADTLADAFHVFRGIFRVAGEKTVYSDLLMSQGHKEIIIVVAGLSTIFLSKIVPVSHNKSSLEEYISGKPLCGRWALYLSLVLSLILFAFCTSSTFIYNRF